MRCPHCDTENESNAIFCKNCNAWILGTIYEEAPETEPQPEETAEAKPASVKKRKWQLPVAAALALVLIIGVIWLWPRSPEAPESSGPLLDHTTTLPITTPPPVEYPPETLPPIEIAVFPNYTYSQGAMSTVNHEGKLYFIADAYAMQTDIPVDPYGKLRLSKSLSGTHGAYLDQEGNLYCIDGKSVTKLDSNVADYRLSASGKGLAYYSDQGLKLYEWGKAVAYGISDVYPIDFCISPNGEKLAYLIYEPLEGNPSYALVFFTGSEMTKYRLFDHQVQLIAISDDASTVYVRDSVNLLSVSGSGKVTELGDFVAADSIEYTLLKDILILNSDHSQLLYYQPEGTYLSENGAPGRKLSKRFLEPVLPEGTAAQGGQYAYTFPADTMLGVVYTSLAASGLASSSATVSLFQKDLLFMDSSGNATLLEENIADCQVIANGTYLFYSTNSKHLYTVDLLTGNKQEISTNAGAFAVTRDGQYLYYMMDDLLVCVTAEDRELTSYLGKFTDPTFYFSRGSMLPDEKLCVLDGDKLQVISEFGGAISTFVGVEQCTEEAGGIVYVTMADGIFCVSDLGRLQEVLSYTVDTTHPDIEIEPIAQEG